MSLGLQLVAQEASLMGRPDVLMELAERDWVAELRGAVTPRETSLGELRGIVLNGLRIALRARTDVNEAHLQDFAQEALLRIMSRLDDFEGRSRFTTWAHAIAINLAFTELRRKRWQDVSLDTLTTEGRHLSVAEILPDARFETDDECAHLMTALRLAIAEALTDRQRAAILGQLRGMPIDQLIDVLGINRSAMYKLFHDARRALKRHLEAQGVSPQTIQNAFQP
jgi:RNA polymerase sigma-70 factor (ECF subfamily)